VKKLWIVGAILSLLIGYILLAMGMSQADTFNPGSYPLIYRSGATPGATPTSGSGVIYAPTAGGNTGQVSALGNCEFYNSSTATRYYTVYDSATVAGQAPSNALCFVACPTVSTCACNASTSPPGPQINGGLVAKSGLSWGESATFPGPTASPNVDSAAICTYIVR
jgi:hypothetical protein